MNSKLCIYCKHFYFIGPDNSPDTFAHIACNEDKWDVDPDNEVESYFRRVIKEANICPDYEEVKDA